jgi:phosphoribosylformylglycinamidine cyclo-ligase
MRYTVDIDKGNEFAKSIPGVGGFSGTFPLPDGQILVSGADGVGTKINIARIAGDYTTIGIDLVAMCVNDVITSGAKPLYFLDYISTQKIDANVADIMVGIYKGCEIAGMKLLGGETAEHYKQSEYDLAGFCTGIVSDYDIITGVGIKKGDSIVGVKSSGLHSNGFSLINDMLWRHELVYKEHPEILTPTHIYAPMVSKLMEDGVGIFGMAHITGGGLQENIDRIIPQGLHAHIDWTSWERPEIYNVIQRGAQTNPLTEDITEEEMRRVFNCGIGYCIVTPYPDDVMDIIDEDSMIIGEVVDNS